MTRSPAAILLALALAASLSPTSASEMPMEGSEAEEFLRAAEIVGMVPLPIGITNPQKATLLFGERTAHGVWKTFDQYRLRQRFSDGRFEAGFRDTYKHEIAVYELDKLLGLGLVPPTVERRIGDETGSLQLWIEGAMMEADRLRKKIRPPDLERWNRQMHNVRLLNQLTHNTDYKNVSNLLIDADFRLYAIDYSRAFRLDKKLRSEASLMRFSRPVLERLAALTPSLAREKLGRWLSNAQIKALLKRRDRMTDLAARRVTELGEEAVLFD